MAAALTTFLYWNLLAVCLLKLLTSAETMKAKPGENIILPCRALNNNTVIVVEWSRADLDPKCVLFYRDNRYYPNYQNRLFEKRVNIMDTQIKTGDASLNLTNVNTADSGTYECYIQTETSRRKRANPKPSHIIHLRVVDLPGQPGGDTEDGGKEDGNKHGNRVHLALIVPSLFICVVIILITVKTRKHFCLTLPPDKPNDAEGA